MNNKIIQQMQNHLKVVSKKIITILIFLFVFISYSQTSNDDYAILNVVVIASKNNDSIFKLNENINFPKKGLKNYYRYRFLNEHPVTMNGADREDKKPSHLNEKQQKEFDLKWFHRYKILDKIVSSQKEMEYLLGQDGEVIWNQYNLNSNIKIIKKENVVIRTHYVSENSISKPIYTYNNKYAIVYCHLKGNKSKLIVLKKENDAWEKISEILNVF